MPPGHFIIKWDLEGNNRQVLPCVAKEVFHSLNSLPKVNKRRPYRTLTENAWYQRAEDEEFIKNCTINFRLKIRREPLPGNKNVYHGPIVFHRIQEFFDYPGNKLFSKRIWYKQEFTQWFARAIEGDTLVFLGYKFTVLEKQPWEAVSYFLRADCIGRVDIRDPNKILSFDSLRHAATADRGDQGDLKLLDEILQVQDVYFSHDGYIFRYLCDKYWKALMGIASKEQTKTTKEPITTTEEPTTTTKEPTTTTENPANAPDLEKESKNDSDVDEDEEQIDAANLLKEVSQENPWENPANAPDLEASIKAWRDMALGRQAIYCESRDHQGKAISLHYFTKVLGIPSEYIEVFQQPSNTSAVDSWKGKSVGGRCSAPVLRRSPFSHSFFNSAGDIHIHHPVLDRIIRIEVKIALPRLKQTWDVQYCFGFDLQRNQSKYDIFVGFCFVSRPGSLDFDTDYTSFLKSNAIMPEFVIDSDVDFSKDLVSPPNLLDDETQKRLFTYIRKADGIRWIQIPCLPQKRYPNQQTKYLRRFNDPSAIMALDDASDGFFSGLPKYQEQHKLRERQLSSGRALAGSKRVLCIDNDDSKDGGQVGDPTKQLTRKKANQSATVEIA